MEITARIHSEEGSYWAEVPELPGVFASGDTLDELVDALREAVSMVLDDHPAPSSLQVEGATLAYA